MAPAASTANAPGGQPPQQQAGDLAELSPADLKRQLANARAELQQSLQRKRSIDRSLATLETSLYALETSYLSPPQDGTVLGNVVKGYDNYLKALSTATLGPYDRKRTRLGGPGDVRDEDRLFSRSSETYQRSLEIKETSGTIDEPSSDDEPSSKRRRMR